MVWKDKTAGRMEPMNRLRRFFYYDLPVLLYAALIFWLSHRTYTPYERQFLVQAPDKLLHVIEFGIFGFLVMRWFCCVGNVKSVRRAALWALLVVAFYAAFDEIHQYFRPDRVMSFWDWVADLVGGGIGIGVWLAPSRVKKWLTDRNTL